MPERVNEVKHAICSAEKAMKILNYKTRGKIDKTISNMINHIKEAGPKEFKYNYDLEIVNEKTPKTWTKKII